VSRATTMPGGAPLRRSSSKRPCKYGARDSDGLCPKKPKAAPKPKKPCKYGARVNGLCPKKPFSRSSRSSSASSAESSSSVLDRQIKTKTKTGRTTTTTPRKVITKVADQVAREAGNKAADATYEWLKKPENRDALKTGAIVALGRLRALASPIAAILAGAWAGWKIGSYNSAVREQGAQNYASSQIALVTKLAKRALTIKEATLLRDFHADQFRKAYDAKLREERSK